jgi:hypothetical protein
MKWVSADRRTAIAKSDVIPTEVEGSAVALQTSLLANASFPLVLTEWLFSN